MIICIKSVPNDDFVNANIIYYTLGVAVGGKIDEINCKITMILSLYPFLFLIYLQYSRADFKTHLSVVTHISLLYKYCQNPSFDVVPLNMLFLQI